MCVLNVTKCLFILILINGYYAETNFGTTGSPDHNKGSSSLCEGKPCINKCCGLSEYKKRVKCLPGLNKDYSTISVYDENLQVVDKKIPELFHIVPGKFKDLYFQANSYSAEAAGFKVYLMKNGYLKLELPNAYQRWLTLNQSQFCLEYRLKINSTTEMLPTFYVFLIGVDDMPLNSVYLTFAIYISCFFLLLVLIVYSLLKELRNLGGKILMAYVGSLFMAFFLLAIIQRQEIDVRDCQCLTYSIYFFFLSTFCWMSVMSYDIWWTFRGYAKARPIHRRGENFKFIMYCLYAWGLPFSMTMGLMIVNETPLEQYPWIITPKIPIKGCFLEGGEKLLYFYTPMLILILGNWLFYLMTAVNLWRLSRGTAVLDTAAAGTPAAHRSQRDRFMVYLKLSIVMGLNWVLEVISFVYPGFKVWYLTDIYNIFIGVAIFLIFCCKPKIFRKLVKLFKDKKSWFPSHNRSSTTSNSISSQETTLPMVCNNPNGPAYQTKTSD